MTQVPLLTLNNGVQIPAVGFGVFQTPPDETIAAVSTALEVGYRHIDTAAAYGNEREVGEGIRRSGHDRAEVFVETKIWISDYGYDETLHGFDKSAGKLGIEQIDLLILHQALPGEFHLTVGAYQALETLLADGKVRAIGVSNFMPDHLARLLQETSVVPAVNQIEVHPYFRQPEVLAADDEHGILSQAWSPIGGITFYRDGSHGSTLQDPTIGKIAAAHGRTPAQVMLRWHLQQGRQVIPKSVTPSRIAENFAVFDFDLADDELAAIDALDTGVRGVVRRRSRSTGRPSAARSPRGEEAGMKIDPRTPTTKNPPERFTGDVWLDPVASPREAGQRMTVSKVRFAPGARTAWHSHALGQTLHVIQGVAWVQSRGEEKVELHAGQTAYCPPGEEHWHGAAPDSFMEHLAMLDNADDPATTTTWLEHVTDDAYLA